jgi:ketosteroid isomerase-like protein
MSEENLEIVHRAYEAFNARDTATFLSMCDPRVEFHSALERKTYRGPDEMLRRREDVVAVMEDFHRQDIRFLDAGGDRVPILYRMVGGGAGSGVPVSREVGALWQLRNGKLVKGEIYLDQRDALEAAGLRE